MVQLRDGNPAIVEDVEDINDDSWLSDEETLSISTQSELDSLNSSWSSLTSVSSLSSFTSSPPSSPVTMDFGRRTFSPPPIFLPFKRMRLLPPRKEGPVEAICPFVACLLSEEEIDEDLKKIKEGMAQATQDNGTV